MKVFSKLKGIFFDEVDDDEDTPIEEEEIKIKEVAHEDKKVEEVKPRPVIIEEEEKEDQLDNPIIDFSERSERELFRSEKPFTFTELTDDEEDLPPRRSVLDLDRKQEEPTRVNTYQEDYSSKRNIDLSNTTTSTKSETTTKVFKPSPVISPIYGILDKDYKKEEIKEKSKSVNDNMVSSKVTTYDNVRRKAYGTLEDDLEDTLNSLNGLSTNEINEKADEEVVLMNTDDLNDASKTIAEINEKTQKIENLINKIEETADEIDRSITIGDLEDTVELLEERKKEEVKEEVDEEPVVEDKTMTDSTLEHDLFNLIDSMYDDKED